MQSNTGISTILLAATIVLTGCATHCCHRPAMQCHKDAKFFGTAPDGAPVWLYTLKNKNGAEARIITYGGIIQSLEMPDKNRKPGDVVLGYDSLGGYLTNSPYFCALI